MEKKAVEAARIEFNRATDSIDALGASTNREEIETHWSRFLLSAALIFRKLKHGAKRAPASAAWFRAKVQQRERDPLLCYLWKARNAHEHTIDEITEHRRGVIREVPPTAKEFENFQQQAFPPSAALAVIEVTHPHMRLRPVIERRQTYYPPPGLVPFNAGMLALEKLDTILKEAEALVR